MFVKLTSQAGTTVNVRADSVVALSVDDSDGSTLVEYGPNDLYDHVIETPAQIINLIEHAMIANGMWKPKREKQVVTLTEQTESDDDLREQMSKLQLMYPPGGFKGLSSLPAVDAPELLAAAEAEERVTAILDSPYVTGDRVQVHYHEINLCNAAIGITRQRVDVYTISAKSLDGLSHDWVHATLKFHTGDPKNGNNGLTIESLLAVAMDKLQGFQHSGMGCTENAAAINSIKEALFILGRRTYRRELQLTQGYVTPDKP